MTVEEILDRQNQLEQLRTNWENVWEEIISYVIPRRTEIEDEPEKGTRHDDLVWDGSATDALKLLADGIQGYIMSSSFPWFSFRMENERLNELPQVRKWLQEVAAGIYALLGRSNLYRQMHEFFMDGGSFGTATVYCEADLENSVPVFLTRHPREIYIAENHLQKVDLVHRKFTMTARQMLQRFDQVHEEVRRTEKETPFKEYTIIHSVYKNDERVGGSVASKDKRYKSQYLDVKNEFLMRDSGYDQLPYSVWRFYKNSDEVYGRSPAWNALPEIKGINEYVKTNLWAAQMATRPPWWLPGSMKGKARIVPGGLNYYEVEDRDSEPKAMVPGGQYPIGIDREDRARESIAKHFMTDFFLILARAEKEMTATEIREKQEEKAIVLGPTINGLEMEALEPLIERVMFMGIENGWLPQPPDILIEAGGPLRVDYLGPLAQAQRRYFRNTPIRNTMQEVFPMFEVAPSVADVFNWDYMAKQLALGNDLPQDAIIPDEVVAKIRQERMKQQQMQQQAEALGQMGKAAPLLEQAQNGPMEEIGKQALNAQKGVTGV